VYFGYETMWEYTFVPVAFVLVMAAGIALAFFFAVGAARGKRSAARYTRAWVAVLAVGLAADLGFAALSGQWGAFVSAYGWTPVIEMGLLAAMFIGAMLMMAASYLGERRGGSAACSGSVREGGDGTDA